MFEELNKLKEKMQEATAAKMKMMEEHVITETQLAGMTKEQAKEHLSQQSDFIANFMEKCAKDEVESPTDLANYISYCQTLNYNQLLHLASLSLRQMFVTTVQQMSQRMELEKKVREIGEMLTK